MQRGGAVTYLLAFVNVANQFRPLLGAHGLLPVPAFLAGRGFRSAPSIFQWHYSDRIVSVVEWSGALLAALALVGCFDRVSLGLALAG